MIYLPKINIHLPSSPGYQPKSPIDVVPEKIPFRNPLGYLQYIAQQCRPDISLAVSPFFQFTEHHNIVHFRALLRILMYSRGQKKRDTRCYSVTHIIVEK